MPPPKHRIPLPLVRCDSFDSPRPACPSAGTKPRRWSSMTDLGAVESSLYQMEEKFAVVKREVDERMRLLLEQWESEPDKRDENLIFGAVDQFLSWSTERGEPCLRTMAMTLKLRDDLRIKLHEKSSAVLSRVLYAVSRCAALSLSLEPIHVSGVESWRRENSKIKNGDESPSLPSSASFFPLCSPQSPVVSNVQQQVPVTPTAASDSFDCSVLQQQQQQQSSSHIYGRPPLGMRRRHSVQEVSIPKPSDMSGDMWDGKISLTKAGCSLEWADPEPKIDDFEIIKPIAKGNFGMVLLARYKPTGRYFAVKTLNKSAVRQKNELHLVLTEKKILAMINSPYVVSLFCAFQSQKNLYLVMEYAAGGDLYSLLQNVGCLDTEWARQYAAEVVLALQHLHSLSVIHRDVKPDNLLLGADGHVRLSDFGLSFLGLKEAAVITAAGGGEGGESLLRTPTKKIDLETSATAHINDISTAGKSSAASVYESCLAQWDFMSSTEDISTLNSSNNNNNQPRVAVDVAPLSPSTYLSPASSVVDDVLTVSCTPYVPSATSYKSTELSMDNNNINNGSENLKTRERRILGTPEYLAPEVLLGKNDGPEIDWWALGIVLYELLVGIPPFVADTREELFDMVLRAPIPWPEDDVNMTSDAKDLITRLLDRDPKKRLGTNGAGEVKKHAFFQGVDWDRLKQSEPFWKPQINPDDPTDTSYFDPQVQRHPSLLFTKQSSVSSCSTGSVTPDYSDFNFVNTRLFTSK